MPVYSEERKFAPPADPQSILVVQLARLGDFLQTTPLLACLKARFPQARLSVLVQPGQDLAARNCGVVDDVLLLDLNLLTELVEAEEEPYALRLARLRGFLVDLPSEAFDLVINVNFNHLTAVIAEYLSQSQVAGWRAGPDGQLKGPPWAGYMLSLVGDRRLTRLHLTDILASYAEPLTPPAPRLLQKVCPENNAAQLLPAEPKRLVGLPLGAKNIYRRWPGRYFAQVALDLIQAGYTPVLLGSFAEAELGRKLLGRLGSHRDKVLDLMGRTSLCDLTGVLSRLDLLISADSGPLHLAGSLGVKCLALYIGPAQIHETGPYNLNCLAFQARDHCGPCREDEPACQGKPHCRLLITPELVKEAALKLLSGQEPAAVGAELAWPAQVEGYVAVPDAFGLRFKTAQPLPMTISAGLGLALREAGRVLMRPGYKFQDIGREIREEYAPAASDQVVDALAGLAAAAEELVELAKTWDQAGAQKIVQTAPGLRFLANQIGPAAPPRLALAMATAAFCLFQAAKQALGPD